MRDAASALPEPPCGARKRREAPPIERRKEPGQQLRGVSKKTGSVAGRKPHAPLRVPGREGRRCSDATFGDRLQERPDGARREDDVGIGENESGPTGLREPGVDASRVSAVLRKKHIPVGGNVAQKRRFLLPRSAIHENDFSRDPFLREGSHERDDAPRRLRRTAMTDDDRGDFRCHAAGPPFPARARWKADSSFAATAPASNRMALRGPSTLACSSASLPATQGRASARASGSSSRKYPAASPAISR